MSENIHPFQRLTPELIMDAVESQGYSCDRRIFALNSYENRVHQVGVYDAPPLIVKFYRPDRWSADQIREEHEFCFELCEQELPVVAPLRDTSGDSLRCYDDFYFAVYPRQGGHAPEFDNLDNLKILGRLLARFHSIGAVKPFCHRPAIDVKSFGDESVRLIEEGFIPDEYRASYRAITSQLLETIKSVISGVDNLHTIRTHGDCHAGNILWRDNAPHFVDFDDARMAPAVQDMWMMFSGERSRQLAQLDSLLEGYLEFNTFDHRELMLIESLRTLRMLHYSAWLAKRWADPLFKHTFFWFNTARYWGEHILELREQLAALQEPALEVR